MTEERFEFTAKAKRSLAITLIVGAVLVAIGVFSVMSAGEHGVEAGHGAIIEIADQTLADATLSSDATTAEEDKSHGSAPWLKRLFANLWINNLYFTGIAVIGLFFFALQYATSAGWSVPLLRVPLAMGSWLPIAFILMIGVFLVAKGDLFHWTHHDLIDPTSANYDALIAGKSGYLNFGFYIGRMVVFFGGWYLFFVTFRKHALAEDIEGGSVRWDKMRGLAAWFLIFFGVSSSMSAWDWVMSIDPHWFSTMFGWYVFASWWVSGLAAITLVVIVLKDKGYLTMVNGNHLHDLGKFVFGFSIFWTYIWFSQYMLIYYANIPEETVYFIERLSTAQYAPVFYINVLINFLFPFLFLMTRDSKRHLSTLRIACVAVLVGHWIDFWLMITPGTLKYEGGFGFMEIGLALVYLAAFLFVMLGALAKYPLVAKNHPMMGESLNHHI